MAERLDFFPVVAKKRSVFLAAMYALLAAVEIYAEIIFDRQLVTIVKPLVLPVLFAFYCSVVRKIDLLYAAAMCLGWLAGVILLNTQFSLMVTGASLFIVHRIFILILVYKRVNLPGFFPLIIGATPFLFSFLFLVYHLYDYLGNLLALFLIQAIVTALTGGVALANFMLFSDKPSRFLLYSMLFSGATQFLFTLRLFKFLEDYYQPLTMVALYVSHLFLCRFMLILDDRQALKSIETI